MATALIHDAAQSQDPDTWWLTIDPWRLEVPVAIMLVLVPVSVGLRLWSQHLLKEPIDASCICILGAFAFVIALSGLGLHVPQWGLGQGGTSDVSTMEASSAAISKGLWVLTILYTASLALSKFAIIFLYRKIFPTRLVRVGTLSIGGLVLTWAVVTIFVNIFACNPPSNFWNIQQLHDDHSDPHCISHESFFAYSVIPNIIADILLLLLPLRETFKLQMTTRRKLQVSGIFALGGVITLVALIRFSLTLAPGAYTQGLPWIAVEPGLSTVCACLPGMGAALRRLSSHGSGSQPARDLVRLDSTASHVHRRTTSRSYNPPGPSRIVKKIKDLVGWQPMPVIDHERLPDPNQKRNSKEMDEFRRLYEYSGTNPFSQDAYAQMSDTELWGGIRVEQTVDMRVEPNHYLEAATSGSGAGDTVQMPIRAFTGSLRS